MIIRPPYCGFVLSLSDNPRGSVGVVTSELTESSETNDLTVAFNVVESFVLAAACAGIDVTSPAFCETVETVVEKCINEYGD